MPATFTMLQIKEKIIEKKTDSESGVLVEDVQVKFGNTMLQKYDDWEAH